MESAPFALFAKEEVQDLLLCDVSLSSLSAQFFYVHAAVGAQVTDNFDKPLEETQPM